MNGFVKRVSTKIPKLSHEQLEQIIDAISDENEIQDAILESLSTGLIICDVHAYLLQSNKAAERFVSFSRSPADPRSGETPVWNIIEDKEIAAFIRSLWVEQESNVVRQFSVSDDSDSVRHIIIAAMPLVRGRKLAGTILQIDDVTEKSRQDLLLRRMSNLESLTNLAASVAHEIKNPLGSISIHIQLIQKALGKARDAGGMLPDPKFIEHYLDIVNEEIERLNRITVDFLLAVRPIKPNLTMASPDAVITKLAEFLQPELTEKNIELKVSLTPNCPDVFLDEKFFRLAIMNLVKNSISAMPDGGILVLTSHLKNDRYFLTVADNGYGMNKETLTHIFEPYFTTKVDGTGLGLMMVYKIIKDFFGEIDVKSFEDEGTMFVISLPVPQKQRKLLQ